MSDYEGSDYGADEYDIGFDEYEEIKDDFPEDEDGRGNGHGMDNDAEDLEREKGEDDEEAHEEDPSLLEEEEEIFEEEVGDDEGVRVINKTTRRTNPFMTKFEYAFLISQRAAMIENDSPLMKPDTKFIHAIDIAREETELGLNPIIIIRTLPDNTTESWKCSELRLPKIYIDRNKTYYSR